MDKRNCEYICFYPDDWRMNNYGDNGWNERNTDYCNDYDYGKNDRDDSYNFQRDDNRFKRNDSFRSCHCCKTKDDEKKEENRQSVRRRCCCLCNLFRFH